MQTQSMRKPIKNLLYGIYLFLAVLLLSEVLFRIYFAFEISPRVLAYGSVAYENTFGSGRRHLISEQYSKELEQWQNREKELNTVYRQDREMGGYRKFFPNEEKYHRDAVSGEPFRVTINSRGFRGVEFHDTKAPDVIRVLTLGASSTFGFFNRDDETYPHQLQNRLNEGCNRQRFEVVNFAIPKATADNIRSMLIAEGIALDPDVVTFYEGRNDSDQVHPLDFKGTNQNQSENRRGIWSFLTEKLLVLRFADQVLQNKAKITAAQTRRNLQSIADQASQSFLADLEVIRQLTKRHGIHLIIANQQASSQSWFQAPLEERERMRGYTYAEEAQQIKNRIGRGQSISGYEFNFLIHQRLMNDLENWSLDHDLPFVDIIKLLDNERDHLLSYVHLDAYANSLIANSFATEIRRYFDCEGQKQNGYKMETVAQ